MSITDSLKAFYDERAALAYTIEHVQGRKAAKYFEQYAKLRDEIAHLHAAFAQTWHRPSAGAVLPLPWCSVCGRNDRELLPGRMLCSVCNAAQTQDDTLPVEEVSKIGLHPGDTDAR